MNYLWFAAFSEIARIRPDHYIPAANGNKNFLLNTEVGQMFSRVIQKAVVYSLHLNLLTPGGRKKVTYVNKPTLKPAGLFKYF